MPWHFFEPFFFSQFFFINQGPRVQIVGAGGWKMRSKSMAIRPWSQTRGHIFWTQNPVPISVVLTTMYAEQTVMPTRRRHV